MTRRGFLATSAAMLGLGGAAAAESFEISRSKAEWQAMLSDLEYKVMREEATERAYTSPLNDEKRAGTFLCKGCDLPLYASETKYDSGTGWPSFWRTAAPGLVEYNAPDFLGRVECHCAGCGGHLGHCFDDGPQKSAVLPAGDSLPADDFKCEFENRLPRYCVNGLALRHKK